MTGENGSENRKEEFFIQISDPVDMRRSILESSRGLLKCMQSYQKVGEVREKKLHNVKKLRSLMKETGMLMRKLRKTMPKSKFTPLPARLMKSKLRMPTADEVDALEGEIGKIEEALSDLVDN